MTIYPAEDGRGGGEAEVQPRAGHRPRQLQPPGGNPPLQVFFAQNLIFSQAEFGDHDPEKHTAEYLKDFPLLPKPLVAQFEVG